MWHSFFEYIRILYPKASFPISSLATFGPARDHFTEERTKEREKLISLVAQAQKGHSDALGDLFNVFYNDVYYFALKTVKDEDIACDITQDTFVEVINTLDDLQEPAAFVKWMKQITYHQCTRYFKKKKDVLVDEDEDGVYYYCISLSIYFFNS